MKKLTILATVVAAVAAWSSCEPEVFSMLVDMRGVPSSGLDLAGRSISVVYMDDLSGKDTVFNKNIAQGFAKAIEQDYFDGSEAVAIYSLEKDMAADYASRDTLVNIAVESGDDVVFLFDSPEYEALQLESRKALKSDEGKMETVHVKLPFRLNMYAYDTLGERDTVRVFSGQSVIEQDVICPQGSDEAEILDAFNASSAEAGDRTGTRAAVRFLPTWTAREFAFYHSSFPAAWDQATLAALQYDWHRAIELWMSMLKTGNVTKRAALEYNIANAMYIMGDSELARKWSDLSSKDCDLPLNQKLRKQL